MKRLLIVFIFFPLLAIAQKEKPFNTLIEETNHYLNQYSRLFPFDDEYKSISSFGLSEKEKKDLLDFVSSKPDNDSELSENHDSISNWYMIYYYQEKIKKHLKSIVNHSYFSQCDIRKLITSDELSIVVSEDKKLVNFSFDEKTGGTYRSRISIMHYAEFIPENLSQEEEFQTFFSSDGFNHIYSIDTENGVKYVLTSFVRFCSLCFGTSVRLVSFHNGKFIEDFEVNAQSRNFDGGVSYNPLRKIIDVDYFLDDLTSYCNCNPISEAKGELSEEDLDVFNYNCKYSYVFNGSTFDKVDGSFKKTINEEKNNSEILSFKILKNNKEVKILTYNDSKLLYTFLKPDGEVEFAFPVNLSDQNIKFRLNKNFENLTFNNGNVVYQIYEKIQDSTNKVGVLVTINGKIYDLVGDVNSLTGSLKDIDINNLQNVRIE